MQITSTDNEKISSTDALAFLGEVHSTEDIEETEAKKKRGQAFIHASFDTGLEAFDTSLPDWSRELQSSDEYAFYTFAERLTRDYGMSIVVHDLGREARSQKSQVQCRNGREKIAFPSCFILFLAFRC
jgi:hypothetical protein